MSQEIQAILEPEEKILWEGKQDFKTTAVKAVLGSAAVAVIAWFFGLIGSGSGGCTINGEPASPAQCTQVFSWFSYVAIAVCALYPVGALLNYLVTHYAITNKRLLIKSGIIGADMRSVYYDQVRSAFVNVGLIGKIFGSGSILIDTGRITQSRSGGQHGSSVAKTDYDRFNNINKPYEVYKLIQECLSSNKEGLHSGRSDYESNREEYKKFVQDTEKIKKEV